MTDERDRELQELRLRATQAERERDEARAVLLRETQLWKRDQGVLLLRLRCAKSDRDYWFSRAQGDPSTRTDLERDRVYHVAEKRAEQAEVAQFAAESLISQLQAGLERRDEALREAEQALLRFANGYVIDNREDDIATERAIQTIRTALQPQGDPACTDCGGSGWTLQTERPCTCDAALQPQEGGK